MSDNSYIRGDIVRIMSRSLSGPATCGNFTVLDVYPVEHMEPVYRIRGLGKGPERMVPGSELRLVVGLTPAHPR
jgi:hypothetical protein